jgi:hypothetical protein
MKKIIHFKQKPCLLFIVGFHYFIMEEPSRHIKAMNNVRVGPYSQKDFKNVITEARVGNSFANYPIHIQIL